MKNSLAIIALILLFTSCQKEEMKNFEHYTQSYQSPSTPQTDGCDPEVEPCPVEDPPTSIIPCGYILKSITITEFNMTHHSWGNEWDENCSPDTTDICRNPDLMLGLLWDHNPSYYVFDNRNVWSSFTGYDEEGYYPDAHSDDAPFVFNINKFFPLYNEPCNGYEFGGNSQGDIEFELRDVDPNIQPPFPEHHIVGSEIINENRIEIWTDSNQPIDDIIYFDNSTFCYTRLVDNFKGFAEVEFMYDCDSAHGGN